MIRFMSLLLTLAAALPTHALEFAQSGYLLGANDAPITGTLPMRFRLYATEAGGAPVWSGPLAAQAPCDVVVAAGYYSVVLGLTCGAALSTTDLPVDAPRFLELDVSGITLAPRVRIAPLTNATNASFASTSGDTIALAAQLALDTGHLNETTNPVDWSQLKNVPVTLADGSDSVGLPGAGLAYTAATNTFSLAANGVTSTHISSAGAANGDALRADGSGGAAWGPVAAR